MINLPRLTESVGLCLDWSKHWLSVLVIWVWNDTLADRSGLVGYFHSLGDVIGTSHALINRSREMT